MVQDWVPRGLSELDIDIRALWPYQPIASPLKVPLLAKSNIQRYLQAFLPPALDEVSSLEPLKDLDNIEALLRIFPETNPNHRKMRQSLAETWQPLIITQLFALAKVNTV